MVKSATSLTGNGVRDWLWQRVSAVILAVYTLFILGFIWLTPQLDYVAWFQFFQGIWVKLFTLLAALSLLTHTWVGMWTILTDYVKSTRLRLTFEILVIIALFLYFLVAIAIVWSV
ncbi:MAG: sdhD [Gammaproteobacteria bacterium]|jgi:succinate dehydrogenase / fumarate reductase membrane anchor subunit|nr:sdhD [Gammaproteobacteria bacterium]